MDKQVVFKTSAVGGFDKKSVLDYIYKLNESAEAIQSRLEASVKEESSAREAAEKSLSQANSEISAAKEKYNNIMDELQNERMRREELDKTISSLNKEIEKQDDIITQKEAEIRDYVREFNLLSTRNAELEKRRAEIDQASSQIGKLLIDAHSESERIIAAAKDSAAEILSQADAQAAIKAKQAEAEVARIKDDAQIALDLALERFSVFRSEMSDVQRVVVGSLEEMHNKVADVSAAINEAQESIHNAVLAPGPAAFQNVADVDVSGANPSVYDFPDFDLESSEDKTAATDSREAARQDEEDDFADLRVYINEQDSLGDSQPPLDEAEIYNAPAPGAEESSESNPQTNESARDDRPGNGEILAEIRAFLEENPDVGATSAGQQAQGGVREDEKQRFLNMLRGWIN